ncbi:MAG: hypothetical protein ABMA64_25145 [Myxococcota bacterium]
MAHRQLASVAAVLVASTACGVRRGRPRGGCPWLLHSAAVFGDGAGGVARGAMAYLPDTEQLLIAGGVVDRGAYQASTMEVRLLNVAGLAELE